jgi:predicted esterase
MRHSTPGLILLLAASLTTISCTRGPALSGPGPDSPGILIGTDGKPAPPLPLEAPPAPPALLDGQDLRTMKEAELRFRTSKAEAAQDYAHAAILQYWLVEQTKRGQYDLACYLARTGKTDPALYWLQVAALAEGVDLDHAGEDADLAVLRADPRWPQVRAYCEACHRHFETSVPPRTLLVLPRKYQKGTPITVVVWLHGRGSRPDDFVNEHCQMYADALNIAVVGVSGTLARGPETFVWSVDAERDAKHVHDALAGVSNRVTVKPGHVIALGFSQGAQVGLEIAVRNPQEFAGAIVLSPGAASHLHEVATPSPLLARRAFVVACGAAEAPGNVRLKESDADWLRGVKAQVIEKEYAGVAEHAIPADFRARFPEWVRFIEQTRGE